MPHTVNSHWKEPEGILGVSNVIQPAGAMVIRNALSETMIYHSDPDTSWRSLNRCHLRYCYTPGKEKREKTAGFK
jgi:hypothetical protein